MRSKRAQLLRLPRGGEAEQREQARRQFHRMRLQLGVLPLHPVQGHQHHADHAAGAQQEFADAFRQHGEGHPRLQRRAVAPAAFLGVVDVAQQAPVRRQHEAPAEREVHLRAAEDGFVEHVRVDGGAGPFRADQHDLHFADPERSAKRDQVARSKPSIDLERHRTSSPLLRPACTALSRQWRFPCCSRTHVSLEPIGSPV